MNSAVFRRGVRPWQRPETDDRRTTVKEVNQLSVAVFPIEILLVNKTFANSSNIAQRRALEVKIQQWHASANQPSIKPEIPLTGPRVFQNYKKFEHNGAGLSRASLSSCLRIICIEAIRHPLPLSRGINQGWIDEYSVLIQIVVQP